ncbi:MAG: condensation domain-containing protein [Phormidesmis sp. CAN_BIN44]|nr:condensation domain-containing protein [Phormidesmis sp. CAN_BIN44]
MEETYSLSPMQQGMLFHSLYQPRSGIDIEQMVCRLPEAIEAQTFLKAWNCTIQRHPILRTSFLWDSPNEPTQVVHKWVRLPLEQQDWRCDSPTQQVDRLTAHLKDDRQRELDLTQSLSSEPLMRFALFQVGDADYQFISTFHHILLDGRSFPLVLQEVFAVYEAFCTGDEVSLESPCPYRDYIEWVRQRDFLASKSFWQQLLKGFTTPTPLLSAQASSQVQTEAGHNEVVIRLSGELTIALKSFAQQSDVTLNTIVQGTWGLLLSRYSGETDVVFGATRACRKSTVAGAESMIGLLINSLPIRVQIDPDTTLVTWLRALRSQHVAVRPHEYTPLVQVQTWSDVPRGVSLFESPVMFEAYDLNDRLQQQGGNWQNREIRLLEQPSFPLVLIACLGSELSLKISYDRTRFGQAAITRMLGHLQTMLEGMVANPSQRLAALPLLTVSERHQLLSDWNDTAADYAQDTCLHELFEVKAQWNPNAIAIVYGTHSLTYGELNR